LYALLLSQKEQEESLYLLEIHRLPSLNLERKIRRIRQPQRRAQLRLDARKPIQRTRIILIAQQEQVIAHEVTLLTSIVHKRLLNLQQRVVWCLLEFRKCLELRGIGFFWRNDCAAPESCWCDGNKVETCYDAEVVLSAFERFEQLRIFEGVGVDDQARGEDDLHVCDGIASEAVAGGEERNST
jgi:hypothetical protein